jgi:hypothetical protein
VKIKAEKKQRSRIFQVYENKISYTLEDGLVVKDSENNTIKLHAGRNITCNTYRALFEMFVLNCIL